MQLNVKDVADNANIAGSKLDINSVVERLNDDGTQSIKSNKIWIDEENQSLGASFKEVKSKVNNLKLGTVNLLRNAKTMIFQDYGLTTLTTADLYQTKDGILHIYSNIPTVANSVLNFGNEATQTSSVLKIERK